MVVTRDSAWASPGMWVAIWLRDIELACTIPTTIQTQLVKWAICATLTRGLNVWITRVYNSRLLLMGLAPLALGRPNYARFHEQQPYFMQSVRESGRNTRSVVGQFWVIR